MPGARLHIAASDGDIRYATGLDIPDPFIFVQAGEKSYAIVSRLEYARARKEARSGVKVIGLESIDLASTRKPIGRRPGLGEYAAAFLLSLAVGDVQVPASFPAGALEVLQDHGIRIKALRPFWPMRRIKSPQEVKEIKRVGLVTKKAYERVLAILREATIEWDESLVWQGRKLTSELVRAQIELVFLEHGCASGETIVSCGAQSAMPHHRGSGKLSAGVPIILDLFPRDQRTGYHFDMTRTVVKGTPSSEVQRLFQTVKRAQAEALAVVAPGSAAQVHAAAAEVIARAGYVTTESAGFLHSTGHGLGLDIHEEPRIGPGSEDKLEEGMVVTVEPGIYLPEVGGVRIEDTVLVTKAGCQNLTNVPKVLVVK